MNKFVITLITCFVMSVVNAQTMHWLTFADTKDPNIGELNKTGFAVLHNRFINDVGSALLEAGYRIDVQYIDVLTEESDSKVQSLISEVQNLNCEENDIVVFYYMGHGSHLETDSTQFPSMLFCAESSPKYVPLRWVHEKLKSKGLKLLVTIGTCSNIQTKSQGENFTLSINENYMPVIEDEHEDALPDPPMPPTHKTHHSDAKLTKAELNSIQKLFLNYKGDIIISSASLGQASFGGHTSLGNMDIFTSAFVTAFENSAKEGNIEWEELLNETKKMVENATEGKQTPLWILTLSSTAVTK